MKPLVNLQPGSEKKLPCQKRWQGRTRSRYYLNCEPLSGIGRPEYKEAVNHRLLFDFNPWFYSCSTLMRTALTTRR